MARQRDGFAAGPPGHRVDDEVDGLIQAVSATVVGSMRRARSDRQASSPCSCGG
ncbi:hypothetical protein [Mycolicibacterium smegmatis]|uniref:Uncharacterized protein n=1 Tax=Mycolicibacterium smegmatis (strain ATCC 700084 / mc(2)155) TaxID=246196 RepID=A0QZG4_MYCS2|nr:hypothetical protein [Mycolicibacterium smegmatis]ABK75229.1 hypothetical protein MSMEG_4015 [Mycolicibacterium smegmatis MC2 155]MBE9621933.1 hypothetical protein [Mycolicibacterium smegmatis]MBE9628277.1 hypothetical protein [Mycolicibacterium smegmatis]MBE9634780.1 hypothetical protein [Mycolicibacterium smegmatis]MBE9646907.1 hypothetical protein [Mycolicibacterium smegmatis]